MVHVQNANYARGEFREVAIRLATVSRDLEQHPDPAWQTRARKAQLDAARYMQMALPADLEPAEAATIAATLPREVLAILRYGERPQANALRKIVANMVTWAIALGFFIIPLLVTFLNTALRFEREHQVMERLIMNAQAGAIWLGACGPLLGNALTRFLETPIGRRLVGLILYVIEGIFGGVLDGYEPHLQLVVPQAGVPRLEQ